MALKRFSANNTIKKVNKQQNYILHGKYLRKAFKDSSVLLPSLSNAITNSNFLAFFLKDAFIDCLPEKHTSKDTTVSIWDPEETSPLLSQAGGN